MPVLDQTLWHENYQNDPFIMPINSPIWASMEMTSADVDLFMKLRDMSAVGGRLEGECKADNAAVQFEMALHI